MQTEICPYCNQEIKVSCGTIPCPKCRKLIDVYPDDNLILKRIINLSVNGLLGKLFGLK